MFVGGDDRLGWLALSQDGRRPAVWFPWLQTSLFKCSGSAELCNGSSDKPSTLEDGYQEEKGKFKSPTILCCPSRQHAARKPSVTPVWTRPDAHPSSTNISFSHRSEKHNSTKGVRFPHVCLALAPPTLGQGHAHLLPLPKHVLLVARGCQNQ